MRVLFVRRGCPFCLEMVKAVNKINGRLAPENRIRIVDCFEYEEFGRTTNPIMDSFSKLLKDGYPLLYVSGVVIEPTMSMLIVSFLNKYLQEEFIN